MWELSPLEEHFDFGFGSTAQTYKDAADFIEDRVKEDQFSNWQVSVCFLRRHSVELFLKSLIIIAKKQFEGVGVVSRIEIPSKTGLRPLDKTHKIEDLFDCLLSLLRIHKASWGYPGKTNWGGELESLQTDIGNLATIDGNAEFFRYPIPENRESQRRKSISKSSNLKEIQKLINSTPVPKQLTQRDDDGKIIEAYIFKDSILDGEMVLLKKLNSALEGAHFGVRAEWLNWK